MVRINYLIFTLVVIILPIFEKQKDNTSKFSRGVRHGDVPTSPVSGRRAGDRERAGRRRSPVCSRP